MSVVTAASTNSGQGVFTIIKIAAVSDGDTFAGPSNPKAYWAQVTADPTTNTSAGINVSESSGTYTFWPGIDALTVTLFIVL